MKKEQIKQGKIEKGFIKDLENFMEKTGQKVTFIAKAIGCSPPTLYGWLDGTKSIKLNTCDDIVSHIKKHS